MRAGYNAGEYIKSDCYRYIGRSDTAGCVRLYLKSSVFRWHVAFRLSNAHGISRFLGHLLWIINGSKSRIMIPRKTRIGLGLYIGHGGPVVVNATAVIGNNCNLSQFTTIGSNHDNAAKIGDNVYIGPNVCIVENVTIGNNVTIGAGSVVTKDIPDNATAAGNYARLLNYDNPRRYIKNPWKQ